MSRRRKAAPLEKKAKKDASSSACVSRNGSAEGMRVPNHRVPLFSDWRHPFPPLTIVDPEDAHQPVFYDAQYGKPYFDYPGNDGPPTWMDPVRFVQLARTRPDILLLLDRIEEKNNADAGRKQLEPLLDKVLLEEYATYLWEQFSKIRPLLAEWMIYNHAEVKITKSNREAILKGYAKDRTTQQHDAPLED